MFTSIDPHDDAVTPGVAGVFSALANEDRVEIVRALRSARREKPEGLSITALSDLVGLSRFATSRHLKILTSAALVTVTASERAQLHRLEPRGFVGVEDWLFDIVEA